MLKIRILSSIVGLGLLIVALINKQVFSGTIFLISLAALNEFYNTLSKGGYKPVKIPGYISCLPLLFISLNKNQGGLYRRMTEAVGTTYLITAFFFIILVALLLTIVFFNKKYSIVDIALTAIGMMYIPYLLSFISLTRNLERGEFFIWLIFIGAWATDTFAYFTGISIGKTKILPEISPKKTLEGSIGGFIGSILALLIYGVFAGRNYIDIPLYHYGIMGALSGIISQLGDWVASAIKRNVKVKDYGNLIPGHGGILDRFDSILFVAPVIYFYLGLII